MIKNAMIKSAIIKAFKQMNGKYFDVVRQNTDLNGQPTGESGVIGAVYGVTYNDEHYSSGLSIELPGITLRRSEKPTLSCLKMCGEKPKSGDNVERCGKSSRIISVKEDGVILTLTLESML